MSEMGPHMLWPMTLVAYRGQGWFSRLAVLRLRSGLMPQKTGNAGYTKSSGVAGSKV